MVRIGLVLSSLLFFAGPALAQDAARPAAPDAGGMSTRLADLEHRLGALEEDVYVSRARLAMLMPDVRSSGGARVRIRHHEEMPATYRLVRIAFAIDGARIFVRADPAGLPRDVAGEVYEGAIPAGAHVLGVELEYRGNGFEVFRYVEGYRFRVSSSHGFHAEAGERLDLEVISYEEGSPFVLVEDAPDVRYREERSPLGE